MTVRIRRLALAAAVVICVAAAAIASAQTKVPPAPHRWVTDDADFLTPGAAAALNSRLEDFERRTGYQLIVYIGRTIGEGATLEEWAVRAFEAWKVGRKGLDDGLALFIFTEDRRMKIEVGYGLEDRVPDARAFRVINDILVPGFRAGQPDEAVSQAVSALIGFITGEKAGSDDAARPRGGDGRPKSVVSMIFVALAGLVFLVIFITNPSLALWLLLNILSGGRGGGGGWGGGGGGFRGGGGRSGGGGASGSW